MCIHCKLVNTNYQYFKGCLYVMLGKDLKAKLIAQEQSSNLEEKSNLFSRSYTKENLQGSKLFSCHGQMNELLALFC